MLLYHYMRRLPEGERRKLTVEIPWEMCYHTVRLIKGRLTMKILVFSDSHSSISFMRDCLEAVKPDALIHLGDHYDDGETIREEYPHIPAYQVPGNCDKYRMPGFVPEILIQKVFGVKLYMTHGHRHNVKLGPWALLRDARSGGCDIALYGHTHIADCRREEDGLWVLNPGAASFSGSAGLIEIQDSKITACRILDRWILEEMK